MCASFGVRKIETGGCNPKANGCVERFHRWLGSALCILRNRKTGDWESYVPPVLFAYKASTNDATGYSPFELNHGRLPQLPFNAMFTHELPKDKISKEHFDDLAAKLKRTFALANEMQIKTATRNEERIAESKFKPDFKPGDEVFIWKKSSKEAKLAEDDREAGRDKPEDKEKDDKRRKRRVPSKLQYRWHGTTLAL